LVLALGGTISATCPVTDVVIPAVLLVPMRWRQITAVAALGSALGATVLVILYRHLGWVQLYAHVPELATNATWSAVMAWVSDYGAVGLFAVAISPFPQTPALIFFGIVRHDYFGVFVAMLAGKALKYALFAWIASRFPERFSNGIRGSFRHPRQADGPRP
jgi:membrane protein YqaA with SNARE-associated domain